MDDSDTGPCLMGGKSSHPKLRTHFFPLGHMGQNRFLQLGWVHEQMQLVPSDPGFD